MTLPKSRYYNNKVVDETGRMRSLTGAFVFTNHRRQFFSVAVQLLYVITAPSVLLAVATASVVMLEVGTAKF